MPGVEISFLTGEKPVEGGRLLPLFSFKRQPDALGAGSQPLELLATHPLWPVQRLPLEIVGIESSEKAAILRTSADKFSLALGAVQEAMAISATEADALNIKNPAGAPTARAVGGCKCTTPVAEGRGPYAQWHLDGLGSRMISRGKRYGDRASRFPHRNHQNRHPGERVHRGRSKRLCDAASGHQDTLAQQIL